MPGRGRRDRLSDRLQLRLGLPAGRQGGGGADPQAAERIRHIRQTDRHHNFTLVCRDLSEIATYAKVDNRRYRLLKAATPGPFTFILQATHEVPRRLQHPRRKTIGIRVPDNAIARALLTELGEPIMSCTLSLPGDEWPLADPEEIRERLNNEVDLLIDGGPCQREPTTMLVPARADHDARSDRRRAGTDPGRFGGRPPISLGRAGKRCV